MTTRPVGQRLADRLAKNKTLKSRGLLPIMGYEPIARLPTGSLLMDRMLGGGLPQGMVVNFWGQESSGKSTMALVIAGFTIRSGGRSQVPGEGMVAYIDVENTFDITWAYRVGVTNPENLHVYRPYSGENALDLVQILARETYTDDAGEVHGVYDLIVLDSIGMVYFSPQYEGQAGDAHVGLEARKFSQWIRPVQADLRRHGTTLLTLNHVTMQIGTSFGDPESQPGGRKLRHANAIEVYFSPPKRVPASLSKPLEAYIFRMRARKNKTAVAKRAAEVWVNVADNNFGMDIVPELAGWGDKDGYGAPFPGLMKECALLTKEDGTEYTSGRAYFNGKPVEINLPGTTVHATTKNGIAQALRQNPDLRAEVIEAVYEGIQYENSHEGILKALQAGILPVDDLAVEVDEPEEDPRAWDDGPEGDPWEEAREHPLVPQTDELDEAF